jgi:hypothetical protein
MQSAEFFATPFCVAVHGGFGGCFQFDPLPDFADLLGNIHGTNLLEWRANCQAGGANARVSNCNFNLG